METDDMYWCEECGIYFNVNFTKRKKCEYETMYFICPNCSHNVEDVRFD